MKKVKKTGNELIDFMILNSTDINFLFREREIKVEDDDEETYFVPPRIALLVIFTYIDTLATIYDLYKTQQAEKQKERIDNYAKEFIFTDKNKDNSKFKPFFDNPKIKENIYTLRCSITHFTGLTNDLGKVIYLNKNNIDKVFSQKKLTLLKENSYTLFIVEDFKELIMRSGVNLLNMFANELTEATSQGKEKEYQNKFNKIYDKLKLEGSKGFDSLSLIK